MKQLLVLLGLTGLLSISASAVVLSDGTNVEDWRVYTESGGEITTHDGVLNLSGTGKSTGYRLDIAEGIVENPHTLKWSMRYRENFTIYVRMTTTNGMRYLIYTPREDSRGRSGNYIRIGLGNPQELLNGRWHEIKRSLIADLQNFEEGNNIVSVDRFLVRGSGELDEIRLNPNHIDELMQGPVEDAENGNTDGWSIYSGDAENASIENIYDANQGSYVIKLEGEGKGTGYRFRNRNIYFSGPDSGLCWDMKASENYTVYLRADTPNGRKYITYTPRDEDRGVSASGRYVRMGLGTDSMDGQWHQYCVEPAEILYRAFDNDISYLRDTHIQNIYIRGSVSIDNIFPLLEG